jgi:hypothetical protein
MSRLEDAQQRVETALSKLDAAIDRRLSELGGGESSAELEALLAEKSRLEATTSAVAGQLDQTIERLQRLLKD